MDSLELRTASGVTLAVPGRLDAITTYVLLEQETWFEKEIALLPRLLRPGMTAIDIGANLGVYSIAMAKLVGPAGRVHAYEPASAPRALLARSRELNAAHNLDIDARALSDGSRQGNLAMGHSSELNALGDGPGERVEITSLDAEDAAQRFSAPDFVKIDAEGEEERILRGGRAFFDKYSPLVMFEIKAEDRRHEALRAAFSAMGYGLFRFLPAAGFVPFGAHEAPDPYELNLFAAKPDRAAALAGADILVECPPPWTPGERDRADALALLRQQPFCDGLAAFAHDAGLDPAYRDGLAAYAVWCRAGTPMSVRCAALEYAYRSLKALCATAPTPARRATFARVAHEWSARFDSVEAARDLLRSLTGPDIPCDEPFWPACRRYDDMPAGRDTPFGVWFTASVAEHYEWAFTHSSYFTGSTPVTDWLAGQPFASAGLLRRKVLLAALEGRRPGIPARLCAPAADHLNADVWRAGKIPGTVAG